MSEPFEAPSVQAMVAWALPPVTEVMVGAPGLVAGVTGLEGADESEAPTPLVAVTETV